MDTRMLDVMTKLSDPEKPQAPPTDRADGDYSWLREAMASVEYPEIRTKRLLCALEGIRYEDPKAKRRQAAGVAVAPADGAVAAGAAVEPKPEEPAPARLSADDAVDALEQLADLVEDLNVATEFCLMDGPRRILAYLESPQGRARESPEVRRWAAMTVGQASQNHEKLQLAFLEVDAAKRLVPLLLAETDSAARAAFVLALSSVTRECTPAIVAFTAARGMDALVTVAARHAEGAVAGAGAQVEIFVGDAASTDNKSAARALRLATYMAEKGLAAKPMAVLAAVLVQSPSDDVAAASAELVAAVLRRTGAAGADLGDLQGAVLEKLGRWARGAAATGGLLEEQAALLRMLEIDGTGAAVLKGTALRGSETVDNKKGTGKKK